MVKARALVVAISKGQTAIDLARKMHLINHSLKITTKSNELLVPLLRPIQDSEYVRLSIGIGQISIVEREFSERSGRPRTLEDALKGKLPQHLLAVLPKSLDVVGQIAIIGLPSALVIYDSIVGKGVLEICPNVRTVMAKAGEFSTEYRTRELRLIAGEDDSVTRYMEHGCVYELDVKTVFFSPRLSHERLRVASQVRPGEIVVDMFAGVGPYSILVAKKQLLSAVHAIDANPSAYKFLVSNILSNRVLGNVKPMMGDAREVVKSNLSNVADRVIMNLPGSASNFIDVACSSLREKGGIIHFYSFESTKNAANTSTGKLRNQIEASGRKLESILAVRTVKEIAPYRVQVAVDARVV
jgi:tRNA (guanine37-N1)-methyltransferase